MEPAQNGGTRYREGARRHCSVCHGRVHRHDSKLPADFDCYFRQFSNTRLPVGHTLPLTPSQLRGFADWLEGANARPRPPRGKEDEPQDPDARVYF